MRSKTKWIDFIKNETGTFLKENEYYICSLHFNDEMINQNEQRMSLNNAAYPCKPESLRCMQFIRKQSKTIEDAAKNTSLNSSNRCSVISDVRYNEPLSDVLMRQIKSLSEQKQKLSIDLGKAHEKIHILETYIKSMGKFCSENQLNAMQGRKVQKWDDETIMKSIDFSPGQKRGTLKIDEKSVTPARELHSDGTYVGNCTLPPSNTLAQNAFVVLLTLMQIRLKIVVAIEFSDKTLTGEIMRSRSNHIIHPNDITRILRFNPDQVHNDKNIAGAFRKYDVIIPSSFVEEFNLVSNKATMKDVNSLYNKQKNMILQASTKFKAGSCQAKSF
ncbi:hypothetical protein PVAND_014494 [Polypedilum vanderplanki]|uniref:THAP-type domain-containing protein n=1 Tax=Polypedilum vanderplanki TaxID=319348 RepID=A0A9J6BAC8_POLVA|nr:hypothetical protein PVAND_014494 [Polypedilum vanderplanki]